MCHVVAQLCTGWLLLPLLFVYARGAIFLFHTSTILKHYSKKNGNPNKQFSYFTTKTFVGVVDIHS